MTIKQLSNRSLMALGTAEASAELQDRQDRVAAAKEIIERLKGEQP
jgi:hypothetical protein